jgi:cytochrome bd-type quinol oxidase subunit 1
MFKFKTVDNAVTRANRKTRIEKAKTITIVTVMALAVGFMGGFKAQETLQAKYTKLAPVAQAAAETTATPAPQSK